MDQAVKKAVEANRLAIMTLIEASGPQNYKAIQRECATQAYGHEDYVAQAVQELVKQGALYVDILYPGEADEWITYDLPCTPWPTTGA